MSRSKNTAAKNDARYRDLTGSKPNTSIPLKNAMQQ